MATFPNGTLLAGAPLRGEAIIEAPARYMDAGATTLQPAPTIVNKKATLSNSGGVTQTVSKLKVTINGVTHEAKLPDGGVIIPGSGTITSNIEELKQALASPNLFNGLKNLVGGAQNVQITGNAASLEVKIFAEAAYTPVSITVNGVDIAFS